MKPLVGLKMCKDFLLLASFDGSVNIYATDVLVFALNLSSSEGSHIG